jgi:hypothetical protein
MLLRYYLRCVLTAVMPSKASPSHNIQSPET